MSKKEFERVIENIVDINPKALTIDDFHDCLLGICGGIALENPVLIYSERLIIQKLMKEMTEEEAVEYYFFNIYDAYMGVGTPLFLMDI